MIHLNEQIAQIEDELAELREALSIIKQALTVLIYRYEGTVEGRVSDTIMEAMINIVRERDAEKRSELE